MKKVLTISLVLLFAGTVLADDFNPPDWRGDPLSYTASWDFFTSGNFSIGIDADLESSTDDDDPTTYLYDGTFTHLDFDYADGWALTPAQGGGIYNPDRDATFAANVINWVDWLPYKYIRIQVTFNDGGNGAPSILQVEGFGPVSGGSHATYLLGFSIPDSSHFNDDWEIQPNPDWEQIEFFLPQGTIIEQLIIDTVSIPEPATLMVLAIGGLAMLRRRR